MSQIEKAVEPEMIPYGVKVALLCLDQGPWLSGAREYFKAQGHYLIEEPDAALAAVKLRLNAVDVALVGAAKAEALEEIHSRPGLRRRDSALFVVHGADGPPSLDAWAAFASGADWVLAESDAAKAAELLTEALKRQEAQREPWRMAEK